jgi:hypothetical protein
MFLGGATAGRLKAGVWIEENNAWTVCTGLNPTQ